ncbi:transposase family protein [Streptomyces sp. NPDC006184]|uniref:transposase family protein n=1 Tax=Streptomyces sp. NPDC006184 TaxID=3155455 RepID=UPI0033B790D1
MPTRLRQLALPNLRVTQQDAADLRRFLIWVPDPRGMQGRRYPILPLLCGAAAAALTGARSLIAIGEWIADAPQSVLRVLGFPADPLTGIRSAPHAATVRRLLQRVDGDALDAAIGAYLQARMPPSRLPEPPPKSAHLSRTHPGRRSAAQACWPRGRLCTRPFPARPRPPASCRPRPVGRAPGPSDASLTHRPCPAGVSPSAPGSHPGRPGAGCDGLRALAPG